MWIYILIAVVVLGGILGLWVANAARLAKRNGQLGRKSPTMRRRAQMIQNGEDDR